MPRDYKHRAQRKPKKKPLPAWLWLLTGLMLGGFIVGLVWLNGQATDPGGDWVTAKPDRPPTGKATPPPKAAEVPDPPKPRFDFYNMLPEMEVVVPEEELDQPAAPKPNTEPTTAKPERYLVQVGSFRRTEDADRMKAQLALLGFEAKVVSAKINDKDTRYRVRSGPYQGVPAVNAARKRLADNGFNSIVIRADGN